METETFMKFALEHLEVAVQPLRSIEGFHEVSVSQEQMRFRNIDKKVIIVHSERFELIFNLNTNLIEFRTTTSEQLITTEFMNEMLLINQCKSNVETALRTIALLFES